MHFKSILVSNLQFSKIQNKDTSFSPLRDKYTSQGGYDLRKEK